MPLCAVLYHSLNTCKDLNIPHKRESASMHIVKCIIVHYSNSFCLTLFRAMYLPQTLARLISRPPRKCRSNNLNDGNEGKSFSVAICCNLNAVFWCWFAGFCAFIAICIQHLLKFFIFFTLKILFYNVCSIWKHILCN